MARWHKEVSKNENKSHYYPKIMKEPFNIFKALRRTVYSISGVDLDLLSECPKSEHSKYFGIGLSIIISALFTVVGIGNLTYVATKNITISLLGGLLFGIVTVILNRFVVAPNDNKIWLKRLLTGLFIIIFSACIAFLISLSLQIKIMEPELERYMIENSIEDSYMFSEIAMISELSKKNETIKWIYWLVFFSIILIEIAPLMLKALSKPGMYDEILIDKKQRLLNSYKKKLVEKTHNKVEDSPTNNIRKKLKDGKIEDAINDLSYLANNLNEEDKLSFLATVSKIKHVRNQIVHDTIEEDIGMRDLNKLYQVIIELSYKLEEKILIN